MSVADLSQNVPLEAPGGVLWEQFKKSPDKFFGRSRGRRKVEFLKEGHFAPDEADDRGPSGEMD